MKTRSVLQGGSPRPLSPQPEGCCIPESAGGLAQSKIWRSLVAALGLLAAPLSSHAQSFTIDWFTIDGGGGMSTGSVYSLTGTIGQPDASAQTMTGEALSLTGGFWSLFAVQTPGAPLLAVRLASANAAVVSWPSPSTGFILQQNTDLNTTNWVPASETVSDNGTSKFIIVSPPTGKRFYRLFKP